MYLVIVLLIMYVVYSSFTKSRSNRKHHNVFFCQYVCDDTYSTIIAKNKEESRIKEIDRRREEYLEWSNNCKQIFENNKNVSNNRKVCLRTIDGAA
jgi:hypothetical protein